MKPAADTLRDHEARIAAEQQAARLYPHSPSLQAEWLRAMQVVRATTRGHVLDTFVKRSSSNA